MHEERAEYAAGAGVADHAIAEFVEVGAPAQPASRLSTRTDLDLQVKRADGSPSITIQHSRVPFDRIYGTQQGLFFGAVWLSWEEVDELHGLLR